MKARLLVLAMHEAKAGIDYTAKEGATCPFCGKHHIPTYRSMPSSGKFRTRYHKCKNPDCPLCEVSIKSVQEF